MKKILSALIFISIILLNSSLVSAGLMVQEGSVQIKALEKKELCGILCVFSVYENPSEYRILVSDDLNKFVENIEPNTFTLTAIDCPNEPESRRECIASLCNEPESPSTEMPCITFEGPIEFSFDFCNGIPCGPQRKSYEGSFRAIGAIGAAQTIEPLPFIVHYTPLSGWLVVGSGIVLIVVIIFIIRKRKLKKEE